MKAPPLPPRRFVKFSEAEEDAGLGDSASSQPERRLRATANASHPSGTDTDVERGAGQEPEPGHNAAPAVPGGLVELSADQEAAASSMAARERRRHPIRDMRVRVVSRAAAELEEFLADWFGIEQFASEVQYFEMKRAASKVQDISEAPLAGAEAGEAAGYKALPPKAGSPSKATIHQESLITQHRPYFTVVQSIVAMAFWLIFSVKDYSSSTDPDVHWTLMKAGTDSIWPGQTDLRVAIDCIDTRAQIWRWFTYQYTHIGLAHVTMNTLLNLLLGFPLEGFQGSWRVLIMYNTGVFGGACCFFVSDIHHSAVGMSGGCYALIGCHLGCLMLNWKQKKYRWVKLFFLILLAGADILNAQLAVSTGEEKVSHSIHFGGYVAGAIACLVLGRNLVVKDWERRMIATALLLGVICVTFCLAWGMQFPPQTVYEMVPWCWTRQVYNPTIFGDLQWHCVRCGDQECIAKWSQERWIETVTTSSCDSRGGWTVSER